MNTIDNKEENKADTPSFIPQKRKVKKVNGDNFIRQFIISIIAVFILALFIYKDEINNFIFSFRGEKNSARWEFNLPFNAKRQNILLMGVDVSSNPNKPFDGARSDSIYLITIAPHAKNVSVISIPRDSKVYIHSRSNPDKINHAFAYGGINASIKTIEQALGVRINNYIVVSNTALIDFIDKIGGVDVYVEKNMKYDDYSANLHIDLQKGIQHLDGKAAEGFMRYRKDGLGDIGRIRRQQWFFNALAAKLKEPSVIVKIPEIIKSVSKYIQTDFSFYELAQYAALIKSIDLSQIKAATLPGEPSVRGVVSYWILDPKGVQDVVDRFVYGDSPKTMDRPVEIGILYSPSAEGRALELQKQLEEFGAKVNLRKVKAPAHDSIAVHNFDVPDDTLTGLKNQIPELKNKQTLYDVIGINKAARDLTIILAGP